MHSQEILIINRKKVFIEYCSLYFQPVEAYQHIFNLQNWHKKKIHKIFTFRCNVCNYNKVDGALHITRIEVYWSFKRHNPQWKTSHFRLVTPSSIMRTRQVKAGAYNVNSKSLNLKMI